MSRQGRYMIQRRKTATLNLRMDPELKAAAEKAAAADHRSLTSLFEILLISHLQKRGFLPRTTSPGPSGGSTPGSAGKTAAPRAKKPTASDRQASPPSSKEAQIRALRQQSLDEV
jgi:hypothetical protein